jgi:DNA-directed RNA polymerase subunit K/omega
MSIVDIKYSAIGSSDEPIRLAPKPKYVDDGDDANSDDDDDDADAGSYNEEDNNDQEPNIKLKLASQKLLSKKIAKPLRDDDDDDNDDDDDDDESYYDENDSAKNDDDDDDDADEYDDAGNKRKTNDDADDTSEEEEDPVTDDDVIVDDDDDDEHDGEKYKKINLDFRKNYITETHPEVESHTDDEIHALAKVVRNKVGIVVDPLHKTTPLLTKYEKTRILGIRTKQLNNGAAPYVSVSVSAKTAIGQGQGQMIDGYPIALRELEEKKLPFIIRRPLPSGGTEYWYLQDLEVL